MESKIITLNVQTPQVEETRRCVKVLWAVFVMLWSISLSVTCLCIGYNIGTNVATSEDLNPEPQQMASKLDIPSVTVFSLLDRGEDAPVEQETLAWDVPLTDEELTALLETCEAGHIHPSIGLGLIQVESSFNPNAFNTKSGCYGYCQLNPRYFPADLSPVENIRTGIGYLAQQLERYDNLEAALTAYNAGEDTGDRTYANTVMAAAAFY